jgi:predicted PurR-regulated permease PerM
MDNQQKLLNEETFRTIEIGIRLVLVGVMVVWSLQILRPFLSIIIWSLILAVALAPAYQWVLRKTGWSAGRGSFLFTTVILFALMTPVVMLSGTLIDSTQEYATKLEQGTLEVPPPREGIKDWPVVGEKLYGAWELANRNMGAAMKKYEPQVKAAGRWLVTSATGTGLGILQFAFSLIIAGVFLAYSESGYEFARGLGRRLAGQPGERIAETTASTVRSVARGVLGVALIQAVGAAAGFIVMDVPGAGLWTLLVLLLATVQIPAALVMIPTIVYVASVADPIPTVIYGVWALVVGFSDNFLKPLLLGRGSSAPMAVIFLGAIGGFIMSGIVGLFVGAVVLVVSYKVFLMWYHEGLETAGEEVGDKAQRE